MRLGCLETLHEIDVEAREIFMSAGGERFTYIPALNSSDDHTSVIAEIIRSRLYRHERKSNKT